MSKKSLPQLYPSLRPRRQASSGDSRSTRNQELVYWPTPAGATLRSWPAQLLAIEIDLRCACLHVLVHRRRPVPPTLFGPKPMKVGRESSTCPDILRTGGTRVRGHKDRRPVVVGGSSSVVRRACPLRVLLCRQRCRHRRPDISPELVSQGVLASGHELASSTLAALPSPIILNAQHRRSRKEAEELGTTTMP